MKMFPLETQPEILQCASIPLNHGLSQKTAHTSLECLSWHSRWWPDLNLVKSLNDRLKLLPSGHADVVRESLHFEYWVEVQMYVASKYMPVPIAYWIVPLLVWIIVLQIFIGIELLISWARPVQEINPINVYPPDLDSHGRLGVRHFSLHNTTCSDFLTSTSLIWSCWHVRIQIHTIK